MALVQSFHKVTSERNAIHGTVECGWRIFSSSGRRVLQLDTYGSSDRAIPGKISQSLQFDESSAQALVEIMARAFPRLTWP